MRGMMGAALALALCLAAAAGAQTVRTFVLGSGGRSWQSGGGSIDPEVLVGARARVDTTNAPGAAIDFDHRPGWIGPLFFDPEENVAARVLLEGGSITSPNSLHEPRSLLNQKLEGTVNGDHLTAYERKPTTFNPDANARGIWIILDFGTPLGIHRVRFYPRNTVAETPNRPFQNDFMRGYEVYINPQLTNSALNAPDILVARNAQNEAPVVDVAVPPQYVRLLKLRSLAETPFEIDEVEVYGTGYLSEATYLTDLIDLGDRATVGRVRWVEESVGEGAFSGLSVRVRSGLDSTPVLYRRQGIGEFGDPFEIEVSGQEYWSLDKLDRAPLIEDEANWSPWKTAENGELVTAPGPRRYLQFRLDFTGRIFDARQVGRLQFDYLQPPIADTLRAEVFPRLADAEKPAVFRYAVRLHAAGPVRGFDRLEVDSNIQVEHIRALKINGASAEFEVLENTPERFALSFPLVDGDGDLLEFTFDLPIFRFGTTFSGRAFNSRWPQVPQILEPGNAVSFGPEDADALSGLSVAIPQAQVGKLIGEISLKGQVLTPNGDGVNDEFDMFFNLLQLTRPTPVSLEVYDLAGRRVHTVFAEERRIGPARHLWNARLADGSLLPPGHYIWVLRVEADAFEERHSGLLSIAY